MRRRLESGVAKCAPVETPSRRTLCLGPLRSFRHENYTRRLALMTSTLHLKRYRARDRRRELLLGTL